MNADRNTHTHEKAHRKAPDLSMRMYKRHENLRIAEQLLTAWVNFNEFDCWYKSKSSDIWQYLDLEWWNGDINFEAFDYKVEKVIANYQTERD